MPIASNALPFPFEAARDLLGIVRAIYAAAKDSGASPNELKKIARIGADLGKALELASETRPGTLGQTAAWRRAEAATARVGELVDALTPAEPFITAARSRVTGMRVALRKKPMER